MTMTQDQEMSGETAGPPLSVRIMEAPASVDFVRGSNPHTPSDKAVNAALKAAPVCYDERLTKRAMTAAELQALAFDVLPTAVTIQQQANGSSVQLSTSFPFHLADTSHGHADHPVPVSSSSSTCTCNSESGVVLLESEKATSVATLADSCTPMVVDKTTGDGALAEAGIPTTVASTANAAVATTPVRPQQMSSWDLNEQLNAKVLSRTVSRQGRSTQRWLPKDCPESILIHASSSNSVTTSATAFSGGDAIRLVTGCVPILEGGKILLASSSRKPDWIFPKGGWEQDETLEESAIRECFEEAGVTGVLGPALKEIDYESGKAKKRRLELEELEKMKKSKMEWDSTASVDTEMKDGDDLMVGGSTIDSSSHHHLRPPPITLSEEMILRIREHSLNRQSDDTISVASTTLSSTPFHQSVRMILFPLYVTQVASTWPESGRCRTAVDLDEALEMMEKRPEFKAALLQIKERGLIHRHAGAVSCTAASNSTAVSSTVSCISTNAGVSTSATSAVSVSVSNPITHITTNANNTNTTTAMNT
jgi:NUDIX domain